MYLVEQGFKLETSLVIHFCTISLHFCKRSEEISQIKIFHPKKSKYYMTLYKL